MLVYFVYLSPSTTASKSVLLKFWLRFARSIFNRQFLLTEDIQERAKVLQILRCVEGSIM